MAYESSKCVGGRHTDCVTHAGMGYSEGNTCTCACHTLDGMAREVLTRMCESATFRRVMLNLVHKQEVRDAPVYHFPRR